MHRTRRHHRRGSRVQKRRRIRTQKRKRPHQKGGIIVPTKYYQTFLK